jgi:hypothetical protein
MTESVQLAPMKCPECGAGLQISPTMESFACGYCGTSIRAVRQGGTVSLVAEAIARIQTGTDKTAAELALIRLKDELKANTQAIEQLKLTQPSVFAPEKFPRWSRQDSVGLLLMLVGAMLVTKLFSEILANDIFRIGLGVILVLLFRNSRESRREKLNKRNAFNRDSANNSMRDFERGMEDLAVKKQSIEMQIEKNIVVVNSPSS